MPETLHRADLGRYYKGLAIHAAPGVHEHAAKMCLDLLPNGGRVLEVGSGSGALAARLRDNGLQVTATDLEPTQPWMHQLDLDRPTDNPETNGPFDVVLCVETIEHLENPRAALRAIRKLLRPGDNLLLSTPNLSHPHSRLRFFRKSNFATFDSGSYYSTGHITAMPEWMLLEHLKHSGFAISRTEYAGVIEFSSQSRRRFHQFEMFLLRLIGISQPIITDDGLCLFIVAQVATAPAE
jgi:SAM-dependent methyltransferase